MNRDSLKSVAATDDGKDDSPADLSNAGLNSVCWLLAVSGVFIACSLIRFPIPGVNEPHYLCKARAFVDPGWCSGDFFLQSSNAHAVFFAIVGPFTNWFSLESVALGGRIVSLGLLAVGWVMTVRRLVQGSAARPGFVSWIAAFAFCGIAATGNFSGEWVVGGFESKVPSYGFALIGVARWMDAFRRPTAWQYSVAGFWCGLAMAIHPVVGAWFCVGIVLSEICLWTVSAFGFQAQSARHFGRLFLHGVSFAATAIVISGPGLVPALQSVLATDVSRADAAKANLIQIFWRLAHHLDPSTFPPYAWKHTAVLAFLCGIGIVFVRRLHCAVSSVNLSHNDEAAAEDGGESRMTQAWRCLTMLLVISLLIAAIGTLIGWHTEPAQKMPFWQLRASLLKFYPFRFFDALLPMTSAFVFAVAADRWFRKSRTAGYGLLASLCVIVTIAAVSYRVAVPSGYNARQFASWKTACDWLKHNVPDESLIHGPREGFGLKWYAERAEYVCFKDCPQDAAGILEWNRRLWVMHDWAKTAYVDQKFDDSDLRQLNAQTGITHILTRSLGPFESSPIFQSGEWSVYALPVAD